MSETRYQLACVQVNAGDDMDANLSAAENIARAAAKDGARLIAFPENVAFMAPDGIGVREAARDEGSHPALARFQALAKELDAWLVVGSLGISGADDQGRVANRSFVIDPAGAVQARYDKIHMFDVQLADGESYRESSTFAPGSQAVSIATPLGRIGLTICYDVRFPYLYRALAKAGAELIAVPSAFTRTTGTAHWHTLLRARAIETGSYIFAPAQCGTHPRGRQTFGHALIVNPWGEVIADGGDQPGYVCAEIDLEMVARVRAQLPSLSHDRDFTGPA
jgi:deaminated glutathione amidase